MNMLAQTTMPTTTPATIPASMPVGDAASLERLHDIVMPPPVPLWPPAEGWLVLCVGVACLGLLLMIAGVWRYRMNRYRRTALNELHGIDLHSAGATERLAVLLKRVALSAYPRADVASLTGSRWIQFLHHTTPRSSASRGNDQLLSRDQYAAAAPSAQRVVPLARMVVRWIRHHRRFDATDPIRESDTDTGT